MTARIFSGTGLPARPSTTPRGTPRPARGSAGGCRDPTAWITPAGARLAL